MVLFISLFLENQAKFLNSGKINVNRRPVYVHASLKRKKSAIFKISH